MKIDDERVQFYLRHRDEIEEWAALRSEAAAALDEWLLTLRGDVESLAPELGENVEFVPLVEDTAWPSLCLRRTTWPGTISVDTAVLVRLEWARGKTLLGGTAAPYVGVRSERATAMGRVLREDAEFLGVRRRRKEVPNQWWAGYHYILPEQPFPERAEEYRALLLNALRDCWNTYAPIIDRVGAALAST